MKKNILVVLFCFVSPLFAFAQDVMGGGVSGEVIDENRLPLGNVTVELTRKDNQQLPFYEVTNKDGKFTFINVPADIYIVHISSVGYQSIDQEITVTGGKEVSVPKSMLKAVSTDLDEVQVVSRKKSAIEVKPDKVVFNVQASPTSAGLSGFELLRKSPGVSIDNNDNITLRGVSGVQVFINGKPTYMSGDQLKQFLGSLRAENIENIELIHSPSAKYEAEGAAGIINIVLKKNEELKGWNGTITANGSVLTHTGAYRGNYSASVNYFNKGTSVHASYGISHGEGHFIISSDRKQNDSLFREKITNIQNEFNHNINLGVTHDFNKHHSISADLRINFLSNQNSAGTLTNIFSTLPSLDFGRGFNNNSPSLKDNVQIIPSIGYTYKDEKIGEIALMMDYSLYTSKNTNNLEDLSYADEARQILQFTTRYDQISEATFRIFAIKADWKKQWKKFGLEGGLKYSAAYTDNQFKQYGIFSGVVQLNASRSNTFVYEENITAAYLQARIPLNKFSLLLGLRNEYTQRVGTSKDVQTGAQLSKQIIDYNDLFPNVSVSYTPNKQHTFSLQYARRITRPSYTQVNDFEYRLSALNYRKGNPNLLPQYSHKVDLTYLLAQRFSFAINYTHTYNTIWMNLIPQGSASIFMPENVGTQDLWGLNISLPLTLAKVKGAPFWNAYVNLNLNYTTNRGVVDGENFELSYLATSGYMETSFRLSSTWSVQLSSWFQIGGVWQSTVEFDAFGPLDIAIQKKLFKKKLTIKAFFRDVFETANINFRNKVAGTNIDNGFVRFAYRSVGINITYNFGSTKKRRKQNSRAFDQEEQRMQSSGGQLGGG